LNGSGVGQDLSIKFFLFFGHADLCFHDIVRIKLQKSRTALFPATFPTAQILIYKRRGV
jgi:hypothetical protein